MIRRVWAFATLPTDRDRDLFRRRIEYLRLTDVVLFVNDLSATEFHLSADRARRLNEVSWELHGIGAVPHLITWLRPTEAYMRRAAELLRPLCMSTGARSLLFDAEEPWTRHPSIRRGGEAAARTAVERFWEFEFWPNLLGVTGITYIPAPVRPVAELCNYVLPQAYSVAVDNPIYRPGVTQRTAHERWRVFGKPLVMGLAAWNLNRSGGLSQTGAMQKAITATEDLLDPEVSEVAYWSFRWIVQSQERTAFIRQAGTKARSGISQKSTLPAGDREIARMQRQPAWSYA